MVFSNFGWGNSSVLFTIDSNRIHRPELSVEDRRTHTRTRLVAAAACLSLAACANYYSEKHFDKGNTDPPSFLPEDSSRATVYLFRERMVLQGMIYTPIPPLYFAVDEKLVSIMPLGSYVKLSLPPGQHKFYRLAVTGDIFTPYGLVSAGVDLNLEPGKVYYVGDQQKLVSWNFGRVEAKNGEGMVKEAQLAKLLHAPATVAEFRRRIEAKNVKPNQSPQGGGTPPAPERASPFAAAADALPSAKQVSNFLEGLAAVALVGLVVVAAVAGARGMGPPPQQPFNTIQTARQQAPAQAEAPRLSPVSPLINYESVGSWRNSAGTLSDILRSKDKAVLRITSTGVVYDIENSRIKGSDGSRYTVIGPNIFSDTGASYQVIGNSLFTSDGRSCTKIGINVTCR